MRSVSGVFWVALVLTLSALCHDALAQARDPTVTSDSPEYCGVLMNRISGMAHSAIIPPPTDVAVLSREGEQMCVHGQVRAGILRLRRALIIMRNGEE